MNISLLQICNLNTIQKYKKQKQKQVRLVLDPDSVLDP